MPEISTGQHRQHGAAQAARGSTEQEGLHLDWHLDIWQARVWSSDAGWQTAEQEDEPSKTIVLNWGVCTSHARAHHMPGHITAGRSGLYIGDERMSPHG